MRTESCGTAGLRLEAQNAQKDASKQAISAGSLNSFHKRHSFRVRKKQWHALAVTSSAASIRYSATCVEALNLGPCLCLALFLSKLSLIEQSTLSSHAWKSDGYSDPRANEFDASAAIHFRLSPLQRNSIFRALNGPMGVQIGHGNSAYVVIPDSRGHRPRREEG